MIQTTARKAWDEVLRPWLLVVFGSACVVISVCQTASFIVKFISKPMVTTTILQEVTELHTPWITICPQPGVDFTKLAKRLREVVKTPKPYLRVDGLTVTKLKELITAAEDKPAAGQQILADLDLLVEGVLVPLRKHNMECSGIMVRSHTDDNNRVGCSLADEFDVHPYERRKLVKLGLLSSPRVTQTPLGIWETRLQLRRTPRHMAYDAVILPCSTFKPNVTFSPQVLEELRITFELNVGKLYPTENVSFVGFESLEDLEAVSWMVWPSYRVYLRQPFETIETYSFDDALRPEGYFEFFAGERVYAQLSMELWKFLSTQERPCSNEEEDIEGHAQCYRECIESHLLSKGACLFPGLREQDSADRKGAVPDIVQGIRRQLCSNSSEQFAKWALAFHETDGRVVTASCKQACPKSCLRMNYEIQQTMLKTYRDYSSGDLNIPSVLRDKQVHTSTLILKPRTKLTKLEQQVYSYGVSELLSEIGGSWGLFLGASIISVGYLLEKLLIKALDAAVAH